MDVLREITVDELNFIKSKLTEDYPRFIKDLNYISSAERCRKASKNFSDTSDRILASFFIPRNGKKENCTIFGITGPRDHTVWFFTLEESMQEAREVLNNSQLIRWSDGLIFITVYAKFTPLVEDCIKRNGYHLKEISIAGCHWLDKETASSLTVDVPEGIVLRPLLESDSKFCNSLWAYRNDNSELYARSLINIYGGLALCDKKTGEILSFGVINDHLAIGMMNTVEKARGKGYAGVITKALSKKILEDFDLPPIAFFETANASSRRVFEKIGFKKIGDCDWILIGPLMN